jgi:hypothetical protein
MHSQQNAHKHYHNRQPAAIPQHSSHRIHRNSNKHSSLGCIAGLQDSMQVKQETLRHRLGRRMLLAESSLAAAWQL